jgi:iron complex transport system substrate-binding protein
MNSKKRQFAFSLIICIALATYSMTGSAPSLAASAPTYRTVTDMAGRQVRLKGNIKRIVLLRGRDVYEVSALIGGQIPTEVVGWGSEIQKSDNDAYDAYCRRYPSLKRIPLISDGNGADASCAEQLVTLKPDLVIADIFMIKRGYASVATFEKMGLPLFFVDESSDPLVSPQQSLLALGNALGETGRAEQIVGYVNKRYQQINNRIAKLSGPEPSIYLESGSTGFRTYGNAYNSSYSLGKLLAHVRVSNISANMPASMVSVSPEFVLKSNPDIIVVTGANWQMPGAIHLGYSANAADVQASLAAYAQRPGWQTLKAARSKRMYTFFQGFSMHIFAYIAYEELAKAAYPNNFRDIDPEADFKKFHQLFLPVSYSGAWTAQIK